MSKKVISEQERAALADHEAITSGAPDAKLSDGRTIAQAQADAARVNDAWEASRQKEAAARAAELEAAGKAKEGQQGGTQQQTGGGKKTAATK